MFQSRREQGKRSRRHLRPGAENLEGRALLSGWTIGHAHPAARPRAALVQAGGGGAARASSQANGSPIIDTGQLPFSIELRPVSVPGAPAVQGASIAQWHGKWLIIGGRTNGLHGFDSNTQNFPPEYQNRDAIVIDPRTGRVWTRSLVAPDIPTAESDALTSSNQESYQQGKNLFIIGGYGVDSSTGQSTTFDTLSRIDVPGLINSVVRGGTIASKIRQIHGPLFQVTGGELGKINNRYYLVMGQNYIGDYKSSRGDTIQIYTDAIQSFRIVSRPRSLQVKDVRSDVDPLNFHRRDLQSAPVILPNGRPGIGVYGGVFTSDGEGYRQPVIVPGGGKPPILSSFQQSFDLYTSPKVPLYSARSHTMDTIFLGGISLDTYDPATGTIATDPDLPFVNTISALSRDASGNFTEYVMPNQLPGLLGADAQFVPAPNVPRYSNGVIEFDAVHRPTVVGTMYGGILAQQPNDGPSTATSQMFQVVVVPRHRKR